MGKGCRRRPCQVHRDEETLRWQFAFGKITPEEFAIQYRQLDREGKITRGRLRPGRGVHA